MWEWFEQKGNEHRLLRFGITMEGAKNANPPTAILEGIRHLRDVKALHVDGYLSF